MNISKKSFRTLCRKAGVTLRDHDMIEKGDHVLVGLSGGKDSMIMLEILAERRTTLPYAFSLTAAHIHLTDVGYRIDRDAIEAFCSNLGVKLLFRETWADIERDPKKGPCFACSWHRRKLLFDLTRELKCNKLALGHHRNDAVETLLMNMIYHGSVSSLPYTLRMFDGRLTMIRPLLDMDERQLADYAASWDHHLIEVRACPYERKNNREGIRTLVERIESLHGKGVYHIFKSMNKIIPEYLPQKKPGLPEDPG